MRTRCHHLELVANDTDADLLFERGESDRKHYSRGHSIRAPKRRSTRAAGNSVPLGMAARRNRRWAW
jgi:hypothetical protein